MSLNAGTQLGPYEILSHIGAGGMGEVYRAKDTTLGRKVAIKVLPADVASSPERLQRFEREAKTVAALNHPNIVTVYGIHNEDNHRFIAMELVEGETLDRMITPGGLPLAKIFDIAIPLADALATAHDKGIVHRDLKPGNVMVTKEGRVKVLDFGLAKLTAGGHGGSSPADVTMSVPLTGRGMVIGTVPYMSPEQLRSDPLDHRTDLFSLGIMLYEMATGQRPFKGKKSADVMSAILRDTPRPLHELNSVLPRHLGRIIEHCLEKDAEQRFQSAKDIRNELRALRKEVDSGSDYSEPVSVATAASQPLSPIPSSTSSGSAMSAPTRRGEFWIGVGVIAVAIVIAAWWLDRGEGVEEQMAASNETSITSPAAAGKTEVTQDTSSQPNGKATLAVLPFENVSNDPDTDYLSNEIPASIIDKMSGLSELSVISRSGAFRFDPAKEDASSFGKGLGASVVLTGQLNTRGNNLTIRAELLDVATNQQLWSKRYPRELTDIMAVEADITQNISEALRLELTHEERTVLAKDYTQNAEAYRSLLQGRYWFQKFTVAGWRRALGHFQDAVRIDPAYALAHAELSKVYGALGVWFGDMPPDEAGPKAKQAADTAIALDDTLGEAHAALAMTRLFYVWDWSGAEEEFLRSISLAPESGEVHLMYGIVLRVTGRLREVEEVLKAAQQLDPTIPMNFTELGAPYADMGRYEEGFEQCKKALDLDPQFPPAYQVLGYLYLAKGMYDEAISHFEKNSSLRNRRTVDLGFLGSAYALAGQRAKAVSVLNELRGISSKGRGQAAAAMIQACLGNIDAAFASLEQAYRQRDPGLIWLNSELQFDPLRGDPRYVDLARRMGFEPASKAESTVRAQSGKTMLAVLPFENLSNDPEQEYFSDGMTEEMITRLGRLRPKLLGVIARTSAMRYKNTVKTIEEIGRELGVAYVIEGGVRRSGKSVRINAQLIQVSDQTQIWGDSYTRELSDVFAIQAEVAEAVAKALAMELLPEDEPNQAEMATASSAAHNAYLLGRHYWAQRTPESLYAAIDHFKRAVELDPNYALAYSGLADTWGVLPFYVPGPYNKMNAEAKKAAELAISLDVSLAEAHVSMAFIFGHRGDRETAIEHYRKAVEIDPNNATAHQWYGQILANQGRFDEATVEYERAITLDPLSAVMHADYGVGMLCARRFDKAVELSNKALELQFDFYNAAEDLTWAYIGKGDHDAAAASFENFLTLLRQPSGRVTSFHRAYETSGLRSAMLGWLDLPQDHAGTREMSLVSRAGLFAWCGESDKAFEWLIGGLEEQAPFLSFIGVHPAYDNLRDDPRWDQFLRKAALTKIEITPPSTTP